jgi:hypothetical protein
MSPVTVTSRDGSKTKTDGIAPVAQELVTWHLPQSAPLVTWCEKPATGKAAKEAPVSWQKAQFAVTPVWLKGCRVGDG